MNEYSFYSTWMMQKDMNLLKINSVKQFELVLENKKTLIDLTSISGQANLGHKNKLIINSIKKQINDFSIMPPKALFTLKKKSSDNLLNFIAKDAKNLNLQKYFKNGKIFYTTSGTESVENALKMSRSISNRKYVLARKRSYHGATLGALSVTGDWRSDNHLLLNRWTKFIPDFFEDPDLKKFKKIINSIGSDNISAIILETFTAVNGVYFANKNWMEEICKICKENKIHIILDEVYCGFYRSGKAFSLNYYNVKPDFICMSKGITGGYIPFGAVWTSSQIYSYYKKNILSCGLTNYAHPLGLAAMNSVIDQLNNKDTLKLIDNNSSVLESFLSEVKNNISNINEVRSKGMMGLIEFKQLKYSLNDYFDIGVYLIVRDNTIILSPPLNIKTSLLKRGLNKLYNLIK